MLSLIQHEIVVKQGWLSASQFADVVAISQMTPGPIAINSATYVGYIVTGNIWGSLIATTATALPPMTVMLLVSKFYLTLKENKYMMNSLFWMKPMMVGMIGAAALVFLNRETFIGWESIVIFVICFFATWKKFNPILLVLLSAAVGILLYAI